MTEREEYILSIYKNALVINPSDSIIWIFSDQGRITKDDIGDSVLSFDDCDWLALGLSVSHLNTSFDWHISIAEFTLSGIESNRLFLLNGAI